jgi:hypothetical protein
MNTRNPHGGRQSSPHNSLRFCGGTHAHFDFDLDGRRLDPTDMDWNYGSGTPISGATEDLALLICGRTLPADRIRGESTPQSMHNS